MITFQKLVAGNYKDLLPEVYALEEVVEQTDWHRENVFQHTWGVLFLIEQQPTRWNQLQQKIGTHTRAELLALAATLHDIGKKETLTYQGTQTCCPDHEERGAKQAEQILTRFSLTDKEQQHVLDIIRYHGEIHPIMKADNWEERYAIFITGKPGLELTLLGKADTQASILSQTRPQEYWLRLGRYQRLLEDWQEQR